MNPAGFPVAGGAAGSAMPPNDKPKLDSTQMLWKHVGQIIQAQGPFTGWRESVQIQERIMKVCQMYVILTSPNVPVHDGTPYKNKDLTPSPRICSLRLIPRIDVPSAINGALKFEDRAFREASEKVCYFFVNLHLSTDSATIKY
ncbi:predicted protein [Uncinocarpus reesii 1704]|uniref:Uncharacterized protein n=1 Tax=Uncinocarpus reesii (strain UAMH 1704) TaxID=336963 RepID=C4JZG2_UNCRE|nr:uncharacterized protein UREG_07563 [Uncinocarpus reesii 1704]EEP82698.1 predicted protein [Uncinocarpus reesii 1704]